MTLELSLRRRSTQARCFGILWLVLATLILIGTYLSLPSIGRKTLSYLSQIEGRASDTNAGANTNKPETNSFRQMEIIRLVALLFGLCGVFFACFLLGRSAFVEFELAARCNGLADALLLAGEDFERLKQAAELLVPKSKDFSIPDMFSSKESFLEILKLLRKG